MTDRDDAFTLEESHNLVRLTRPRASHLGAVPAAGERLRWKDPKGRFAGGNQYGAERGVKAAAVGSLKEARKRIRKAAREATDPETADAVFSCALTLYMGAQRDLASSSILVIAPLVRFAVNSALAEHFGAAAAKAGFETEEGARLLALQHACETRAERAETMAIAACKALSERKPKAEKATDRIRRNAGKGAA